MNIDRSVAFVTGANRGLGAALPKRCWREARPRYTPGYADQKPSPTPAWCRSGST